MRSRKPAKPGPDPSAPLPAPRRNRLDPAAEPPAEEGPTRTYPTYFRHPAGARRRVPIRYAR